MNKYPTYKETGIEWIGEIPTNWNLKKLKYLVSQRAETIEEADLNLAVENIESGTGKLKNLTAEKSYQGALSKFCKGDTLFNKLRPYLHKVYYAEKDGGLNGELLILYSKGEIDPKFLFYSLFNKSFIDVVDSSTQGTKMPRANWETFINQLPLSFPDTKEEQTQIANYLDTKTAEIDTIIAAKKKLIQLYEEEKAAIINQAVTKGINPDVKLKPSGVEWLGDIPEHWQSVSLKWISNIFSGGTPSKNNPDYWHNGDIPWLNSGTVNQGFITEPSEYITEEGLANSSAKWIPESSLVMALAGQGKTKGMVAQVMFKTTCNQSLGVIVPNEKVDNKFLMYWLRKNYQNIRNLGGGDKRDGINLEMIGRIPVPITTIEEQSEIVEHIETNFNVLDAKIKKANQLIELLTEYRTTLISEVVTGKIKVTA